LRVGSRRVERTKREKPHHRSVMVGRSDCARGMMHRRRQQSSVRQTKKREAY
jgi:hypothetical protein